LRIEPEKDSVAIIRERTAFQVLVVVDADVGFGVAREPVIVGD
jgi:hypothetical protein